MRWIVNNLWLIPGLPLLAAGLIALIPRAGRRPAATLAIGALGLSFLLSCAAMATASSAHGTPLVHNFTWLEFGSTALRLGWLLDPLSAVMLVMVTFVGTLIFIYSVGYMAHDANFTRFFCFLSLFAAAMLGVIIANNLLLLFICWELVGLASYLLIGFWFQKPSAAAAAKKAFITTRIGDMGLFLGMLWLYSDTGTLLFYDAGAGCLEASAIAQLVGKSIGAGLVASTGIALLIFCGAIGKSGQVPLHVWLPDAMEGPTPVSALIHAATMVAAGVFLMARVYPIVSALPPPAPTAVMAQASGSPAAASGGSAQAATTTSAAKSTDSHAPAASVPHSADQAPRPVSLALHVIAWIGGFTALFAALIAVAQTDIKRILAYSTVSQLGYMFLGLATGGVAVGMFHLITHAFFKALLFLGAGSVIHGCHEEQDIRHMGGLRRLMPLTFLTYAIGMMALSGVPLLFSGFWSKDEILHSAAVWSGSKWPLVFALLGAVLTAFYMTRQMIYVFWGSYRGHAGDVASTQNESHSAHPVSHSSAHQVHESPSVMTVPLGVLAAGAVLLSVLGTPVWPWFHAFLSGHAVSFVPHISLGVLAVMLLSVALVALGIGLGVWIYGRRPGEDLAVQDPLETARPVWFAVLRGRFFIDELYEKSFLFWSRQAGRFSDWLDRQVLAGAVRNVKVLSIAGAWVVRLMDDFAVNLGWDRGCDGIQRGGRWASWIQNGQTHRYLRALALGMAGLMMWILWR
ncbi:MAG: NADH-quinone oxidoreductase subunit L [Verrucomicrobiales bacterium]|nr:NADH-quinone oxidoreductase subunit L [Verrucomicrobiales bacterium]